jgi:acyl-coenzyme A thioesterase PaaI-like protein
MSAVDYTAVAAGLSQAIPFNVHLGLETITVAEDHGVVRLPDDERLRNHVGSQHAGALFAAGEAASGAAFVGAFLDIMAEITPLAESAQIAYKKLAKGEIAATARFTENADTLKTKLSEDGRIRFLVEVEMTNGDGIVVAEMTVNWYVRRNDAAR